MGVQYRGGTVAGAVRGDGIASVYCSHFRFNRSFDICKSLPDPKDGTFGV